MITSLLNLRSELLELLKANENMNRDVWEHGISDEKVNNLINKIHDNVTKIRSMVSGKCAEYMDEVLLIISDNAAYNKSRIVT